MAYIKRTIVYQVIILSIGLIFSANAQTSSFEAIVGTNSSGDFKAYTFDDTVTFKRMFTPGFNIGLRSNLGLLEFLKISLYGMYSYSDTKFEITGLDFQPPTSPLPQCAGDNSVKALVANASFTFIPTQLIKVKQLPFDLGFTMETGTSWRTPNCVPFLTELYRWQNYQQVGWGFDIDPKGKLNRFTFGYRRRNLGYDKLHFVEVGFHFWKFEHKSLKDLIKSGI
jgi:hypothetical protein